MQLKDLQLKRAMRAALMVLLLGVAGMTNALAQIFTSGNLRYFVTGENSVQVIGHNDGTSATGSLAIPSSVTYTTTGIVNGQGVPVTRTYTVTSIGSNAFYECISLTGDLFIPNSVTSIGNRAFCSCSGLTSLIIGNSVTSIGSCAFENCSGFTGSLNIPNSVTSIGSYAFYNCSGFTGSLTIPTSVTTIEYGAFYECSGFTGSLTIPSSVTSLGEGAFYGCSGFTGSLTIPNSVTSIGVCAFRNCSGFTCSLTIGNSVTTIGNYAFDGCSGFTGSLTIPNSVTSIGYNAFHNCSGFTGSLTIPNSVTSIGSAAFYGCNFNGVNINMTNIPNSVFSGCSGFTGSLTIGNSVTTISGGAFYNCSGFTGSLTIPNSVTSIGNSAFSNCSGFTGSLTIPNSVTSIGYDAFRNCSGFTGSLTIPNSVTSIGSAAFYGCNFNGVNINMTNIPNSVFSGCSGFTGSLTIPNSVTSIGDFAFAGCSGFSEVYYNVVDQPDYPSFDESPFNGCGGNLIIGDNVQRIPGRMFALSNFTGNCIIPHSVTSIGRGAFASCSGFTGDLVIPNSVTEIGRAAFSNCSGFTGLTISNSVTEIVEYAFYNCSGFTGSLTIPNSVTSIGESAFENCSGFTGCLTIPNAVTSIGSGVFYGCSGFTEVHYNAANVTSNSTIFYECNNIVLFVIGENVESLPNCNLFGYNNSLQCIKSRAEVPPTVSGNYTFSYIDRDIPVLVPCGSVEAYQVAPYWSEFTNYSGAEYLLIVKANPTYFGSAIIVQEPDCNSPYASVRAAPRSGCHFINWTCNGEEVSRNLHYSFNMEEDMILTANFESHSYKRFVHTVSFLWSDSLNWEPAGVPAETMLVDLQSDVVIDTDVIVSEVSNEGGHVLTILPGVTLKVTDTFESPNASNTIIEEGGQLLHSNGDAYATVKKTAKTQDENSDNWNMIAYPIAVSGNVSNVGKMLNNQYDLYYYDEPTQTWNNYRQSDNNFNQLDACRGYLYANSGTIIETNPNGIQIDQGSSTTSYFPFNALYSYTISESLFRAEELVGAGLNTEPLGALCWYATNAPGYEQSNISIWMANVSDNELTSTSHLTSDMTLVYLGSMTPILGWNEFAFNEDTFAWDGTSNILICVQRNNEDYSSPVYWRSHNAGFTAMSYKCAESSYNMSGQTYSMSTSSTRPNIVFETAGHLGESVYHPVTLSFTGQLQNGTTPISIPLSYTEGIDHPGYNLVGNPYVHNVTSYASENVAEGCFRMNETQDEIIVSEISEAHPLKPTEGFFVKAIGENASITFNPQAKAKASHGGSIRLEITENGQLIDRFIVKEEGEPLEKLSLKKGSTKLFATKGQREMAMVPVKGNEQAISFKAAHDGTFTLSVEFDGMEVGYLHLIDDLTGEDIDLLAAKAPVLVEGPTLNDGFNSIESSISTSSTTSYTFDAKTTDDISRFKLVFSICGDEDGDNGRLR